MSKNELIKSMIEYFKGILKHAEMLSSANATHVQGNIKLYCSLALKKLESEKDNQN